MFAVRARQEPTAGYWIAQNAMTAQKTHLGHLKLSPVHPIVGLVRLTRMLNLARHHAHNVRLKIFARIKLSTVVPVEVASAAVQERKVPAPTAPLALVLRRRLQVTLLHVWIRGMAVPLVLG